MSSMNPLPPQAYTKDVLLSAYQWLQGQTEHVKELATNPDIMVSLFLKAKQEGEDVLLRPSIKNFKMELKNLAGKIDEFDQTTTTLPPHIVNFPMKSKSRLDLKKEEKREDKNSEEKKEEAKKEASLTPQERDRKDSQPIENTQIDPVQQVQANQESHLPLSLNNESPSPNELPLEHQSLSNEVLKSIPFHLDSKSLHMIRELRAEYNLSHDSEALRMIISLGYKKFKTFTL